MGQYQHQEPAATATSNMSRRCIGPNTIDTMPLETLEAYRDHGQPQSRLQEHVDAGARDCSRNLPELGVDIEAVTQQLEDEGIDEIQPAVRQADAADRAEGRASGVHPRSGTRARGRPSQPARAPA